MPNTKRGFGGVGLILVILIILGGGAYLWSQKKVSNFCLTQDSNEKVEETITKVISQFESFLGKKDIKLLTTCMTEPLANSLAAKTDLFPFETIIGYVISDVLRISDEKYTAKVNERRLVFKSGISGGSYPEETKKSSFVLEKIAGRWVVTSYGDVANLLGSQADWKTYRNDEYGFEIKYPSEWIVDTKGFGIVELMSSLVSGGLTIHTAKIPEEQTLDKYLEIIDDNICGGVPCRKVLDRKEIIVADYPAIQRRESWSDCPCTGQATYFQWNNLVYVFSGAPISSDSITGEEEKMYDKVLSTFRFTK